MGFPLLTCYSTKCTNTFELQLIGVPNESSMDFVKGENAKRYLRELPQFEKQSLTEKFPMVPPEALDLVEKMLAFNPAMRITGNAFLAC